jgi:hypothetical protein
MDYTVLYTLGVNQPIIGVKNVKFLNMLFLAVIFVGLAPSISFGQSEIELVETPNLEEDLPRKRDPYLIPHMEKPKWDHGGTAIIPCPKVPHAPPGVNIDANISHALKMKEALLKANQDGLSGMAAVYYWFYEQVRSARDNPEKVKDGRSWDYKRLGKQYEEFGNFNYGATGAALGIPKDDLLRFAGWANVQSSKKPGKGSPGNLITGDGSEPPYGDDPKDQEQISKGIVYYYVYKAHGCKEK